MLQHLQAPLRSAVASSARRLKSFIKTLLLVLSKLNIDKFGKHNEILFINLLFILFQFPFKMSAVKIKGRLRSFDVVICFLGNFEKNILISDSVQSLSLADLLLLPLFGHRGNSID